MSVQEVHVGAARHAAQAGIVAVCAALAGLAQAGCDRPVAAAPPPPPLKPPVVNIACAPAQSMPKLLQCHATASLADAGEGQAQSPEATAVVQIAVNEETGVPQVAYDVEGAVRDLTNMGLANVEVTLTDERGRTQTTKTREAKGVADGAFRFSPLLAGTYHLKARRPDYRPAEKTVTIPDPAPLTLVMINEPVAR